MMNPDYATALNEAMDLVRHHVGDAVFKELIRVPKARKVRSMSGLFQLVVGILAEAKAVRENVPNIEVLAKALYGFDPKKVAACQEKPGRLERRLSKMAPDWPKEGMESFVHGVVEGARTLVACNTASGFHRFAEEFYIHKDCLIASSLPLVLEKEIPGIGFGGACRFLNQAGHPVFFLVEPKVRAVLFDTGLTESRGLYDSFFAVLEMAGLGSIHPHPVHSILSALVANNLQTLYLEKLATDT
ncbi:hypothetical protein SAMN02745216_05200 [Desulfatibacillum alkenivorans DSM 16219]|jgi:hypothetical protein|uniref:Uncharacterized protein n=1 Tax=Desulfatibacillum alkenivorans DSM 16219 TaxID=1121393 RepID=A0A1M7ANU0_9BACT|nr:hypothetical protein [Desulfatibacillum alkenivorans]SHL44453.1 hypothetical protein SAMN02745216_05200 [Desulfatibacillum alkenivorans DSM 16219]